MSRIFVSPNFYPQRSSNEMISSHCAEETVKLTLAVKRFSTNKFDLPPEFMTTPVAPVVLNAIKTNFPVHMKTPGIKGVKELIDAWKGKTMILCGAGFSLNAVIDQIPDKGTPEHKNLVVVAINGALKAIPPSKVDYYGALDWGAKKDWWQGYPTDGIPAIIGLTVPEHLIEGFKDRYYFASNLFCDNWDLQKEWVEKVGNLEAGKCISYSMLHMAWQAGCSKVILLGHDYAASQNMYYWNEPLTFAWAQAQQMCPAQDIFNNAVMTGPIMIMNCETVMTAAKFCEQDGMTVVNASEAGIMAMENRCMPFKEALEFIPDVPVEPLRAEEQAIPAIDWSGWRHAA